MYASGLQFYYDSIYNLGVGNNHSNTTTTWKDLSRTNNTRDGILKNCEWLDDGLFFNGNRSSVSVIPWVNTQYIPTSTSFTIEVALTPAEIDLSYCNIISSKYQGGIELTLENNKFAGTVLRTSAGGMTGYTEKTCNIGEFVCIAFSYDGAKIRMYYNGVLDTITLFNGPVYHSKQPLLIGAEPDASGQPQENVYNFKGIIHSVRFYDRILTEEQIFSNYIEEISIYNMYLSLSGDVSKIKVLNQNTLFNIKDIYARTNKIDRFADSSATAVVNFLNGLKIQESSIVYNKETDTITFS